VPLKDEKKLEGRKEEEQNWGDTGEALLLGPKSMGREKKIQIFFQRTVTDSGKSLGNPIKKTNPQVILDRH